VNFLVLAASMCLAVGGVERQFIFAPQDKHVHSSTIVQCPNGDLLAAWFYGSGERTANDVLIQGARKKAGDDQWSEVFLMADTPDLPDCNPVLWIDETDRLWMHWIVPRANRWERSILKHRISSDYMGDIAPVWEWQDTIIIDPGEGFAEELRRGFVTLGVDEPMWSEYAPPYSSMLIEAAQDAVKRSEGWMTRTRLVTLPSGRIILPLYSDGYNISLVAYSDNNGRTWEAGGPIVGLGNIQPSVVLRSDGALVAYMRDNGELPKRIMQAVSEDGGESWTVARDMDIPNPGSSVAVTDAGNGRWVMLCNDLEQTRRRMTAYVSQNEGRVWPGRLVLDESEGDESYGYPTVIAGEGGAIHTTYSYNGPEGASIQYVSFMIEDILN